MDITPVDRTATVPAPAANTAPVDKAAENREVVQAVKALNGTEMFGDNELDFQRDPQTHRMIVRVLNRKTKEVVSQVPPEYVLRLAEDMKQTRTSNLQKPGGGPIRVVEAIECGRTRMTRTSRAGSCPPRQWNW